MNISILKASWHLEVKNSLFFNPSFPNLFEHEKFSLERYTLTNHETVFHRTQVWETYL